MDSVNITKVLDLLGRSFEDLPVATDLPRLSNITVIDTSGERHSSTELATTVDKLHYIFKTLSQYVEGEERSAFISQKFKDDVYEVPVLSKSVMNQFLKDIGGDACPTVSILKCINQSAISHGVMELKFRFGLENMTKDVRDSWYFKIDLSQDQIVVQSVKRDQCIKNRFQYEWAMSFYLNKATYRCENVSLQITDIMYSKTLHTEDIKKKEELENIFRLYTTNAILSAADTRYWEHYQESDNTLRKSTSDSSVREERESTESKPIMGKRIYENGDVYEGELKDGIREGKGVYNSNNGTVFKGEYRNGKRHGQGEYTFPSGSRLKGAFEDGELVSGKYTFHNGDIYEGQFKLDRFEGKGRWETIEGEIYEGWWKAGQKHGYGRLRLPTGDEYDGEWHQGEMQGKGKYKFVTGDSYKGAFLKGQFHGSGEYRFANKAKKPLLGEFENGRYVKTTGDS